MSQQFKIELKDSKGNVISESLENQLGSKCNFFLSYHNYSMQKMKLESQLGIADAFSRLKTEHCIDAYSILLELSKSI